MEFNPIIIKELRGRMRGWRATIVVTVYLLVISAVMLLFYGGLYNNTLFGSNTQVGKSLFLPIIIVQVLLLSIITPISTAAAISNERERQTYDVLLTTLLPPRTIILGKLLAAIAYSLLLMVVTLPLAVLCLLLGGLDISDVLLANLVLLAMTFLYGSFGLYSSTTMRTTLGATSLALGLVVFLSALLPLFAYLLLFTSGSGSFSRSTTVFDIVNSISPPFAVSSLLSSNQPGLFQPWMYFTIIAALASGLLIWLSVRALRPRERLSRQQRAQLKQ
jgi:ABC-2 type transport system permease protein